MHEFALKWGRTRWLACDNPVSRQLTADRRYVACLKEYSVTPCDCVCEFAKQGGSVPPVGAPMLTGEHRSIDPRQPL